MSQSEAEIAARAAYRLGLCDALLHEDTIEKLGFPGIFLESMRGERDHRVRELESAGVDMKKLGDVRL